MLEGAKGQVRQRRATSRSKESPSAIAMDALRRIVRALRQADVKSRGRGGIPTAQLFVLRQLRDKHAASITDICRATFTSQSSVSEVVARLEAKALLRRSKASDDSRRAELSLTEAGRKLLEQSPPPFQEKLASALRRLSRDEQQAPARGMTAWLREAGIGDAPATMFFEPDPSSS
ncbi:MAG: MarR family transcriptional regulator [Gemmatimonadaceae bacterium]